MSKKLQLNQKVAHKGTNENANVKYTVTIVGFDRLAINVQNSHKDRYWLNAWDLCKVP
jgi:hypothetical protein